MSIDPNLLSPLLFYQTPIDAVQSWNGSTNQYGAPTELTSCRGCAGGNLAGADPASQYQRQKIIQNTVRVYASLYTMNLGALSAYQRPLPKYQTVEQAGTPYLVAPGVYWNQMSDRRSPSIQKVKTASGSTYHSSSTRNTIVRDRPGAMSPGGIGVDIKHNSYDRYLNRLKGKAPIRRGVIPPDYGAPIPFNRAYPIYGGKVVKTSIVNNCNCPEGTDNGDALIYGSPMNALQDKILSVTYQFHVGDFVFSRKSANSTLYKAQILSIKNGMYTIQFEDDQSIITTTVANILIYYDCNCTPTMSLEEYILAQQFNNKTTSNYFDSTSNLYCNILNKLAGGELL